MTAVGLHCLLELYGCPAVRLDDARFLERSLRDAAEGAGATWLGGVTHRFEPCGVTCVGLLAESHIAAHTWPEVGYAAADIFTCGDTAMPEAACERLARALEAARWSLTRVARGSGLSAGELAGVEPASAHLMTRDVGGAVRSGGDRT